MDLFASQVDGEIERRLQLRLALLLLLLSWRSAI
jgi:hypothetical protein